MNKITIDSRECGAGKTHGHKGILHQIEYHLLDLDNVLVVVPSIELAKVMSSHMCSVITNRVIAKNKKFTIYQFLNHFVMHLELWLQAVFQLKMHQ